MKLKQKIAKLEQDLAELKKEINKKEVKFTEFEFKGRKYEISEDLGEMDWYDAKEKCEELGGDLPPLWLLIAIYNEPELKEIKETFSTDNHWSATEYSETYARDVLFSDGSVFYGNKGNSRVVRCVRELE